LYLFAMLPFWDFFTARLHPPFQLYSAAMGVEALRLFGIPVLRDGVFIELPNITLEVAQVCSGVNNLVAVLCLGVPLTHHYVTGWLKRGFIVAMAVLIALLSNGVRVATVCFFAYYGIRGADGDIHGPFALMRTLAISGVGFVALFWLVGKFADRVDTPVKREKQTVVADSTHWGLHGAAWVLAVALLAGAVGYEQLHAVTRVPLKVHLVAFPNEIAGWQFSRVGSLLPSLASKANFDHWTSRVYAGADGEVELLLGYFERQQPGKELGGWELSQVIPAESTAIPSDAARVRDGLNRVNGTTYHLTYWYLIDGRVATEGYEAKLWTTFNSITAGRSNGGLIVVSRALGANESIEASRSKVNAFISDVMRASAIYFPQG
jgi:EpsI family protein